MNTCKDIVFISAHHFGVNALFGILHSNEYALGLISIKKIITSEKDKNISGYATFDEFNKRYNIPIYKINPHNESLLFELIDESKPDYIFCIGWSFLLSNRILCVPKRKHNGVEKHSNYYGCIGMHPTLLPIGRGRAPIPWTILYGLNVSGLTSFFLEEQADSGRIIIQTKFPVLENDTSFNLYNIFLKLHYNHALQLSKLIISDNIYSNSVKQKTKIATIWKKRNPTHSQINLNVSFVELDRLFRAQTYPYPKPYYIINNTKYIFKSIKLIEYKENSEIGIKSIHSNTIIVFLKDCLAELKIYKRENIK